MSRAYYTDSERELVKKYAGIKTAAEIAIMIGRTRNSVLTFAARNKISLMRKGQYHYSAILTDLQASMVMVLSDAGFTDTEINKACFQHVSRGCITNIARGDNRNVYGSRK